MKTTMRTEVKIGIVLFAIFNFANLMLQSLIAEMPLLHFIIGMLVGLSFCLIIIGILPETTYLKLKKLKKNL